MTSPRSIADLEDLLPTSEKLEWAKKVKGTAGVERFDKFKAFLRDRKEELEALENIGNKATTQVDRRDGIPTCNYCGKRDILRCREMRFLVLLREMIKPREVTEEEEGQTEESLSLTLGMDVQYVGTGIIGRTCVLTREQEEIGSLIAGEEDSLQAEVMDRAEGEPYRQMERSTVTS
jgi:hypothetical protein